MSIDLLIEKALKLENQFSQNKYFGDPFGKVYSYKAGSIPIIISAPHSVRQIRDGRYKYPDLYTGSLAILLQELTGCHLIYRTYTGKGDANRDVNCPYKNHLIQQIKKHNLHYLIDLHGMAEDRDFDIDVGTLQGKTTNWNLETLIYNSFVTFGIKDVRFDYLFDADKRGTVTRTIWQETGIHCFQIEINAIYRNIKYKNNYENFYRLICSLRNLILSLEENLLIMTCDSNAMNHENLRSF